MGHDVVTLLRDVEAMEIPDGTMRTLRKGNFVRVLQELGGSYTVVDPIGARYRIEGKDADALGKQPPKEKKLDIQIDAKDKDQVTDAVWGQLKTVHDPEIPFNIVDLGLIYECKVAEGQDGFKVDIVMTLTAPGCGMGDVILGDVKHRVGQVPGVQVVNVDLTSYPPWSMEMMSEAAKLALNL